MHMFALRAHVLTPNFFLVGVNTSRYHPATSPRAASCLGECAARREREGSFLLHSFASMQPITRGAPERAVHYGEIHCIAGSYCCSCRILVHIFCFFVSCPSAWQCLNLISNELFEGCGHIYPVTSVSRTHICFIIAVWPKEALFFYRCAFLMNTPSDIFYFKPLEHAM